MYRSVGLLHTPIFETFVQSEPKQSLGGLRQFGELWRSGMRQSTLAPSILVVSLVFSLALDIGCTRTSPPSVSAAETAKSVTTTSARPHSVTNQELITDLPSPNSLFSKRIPPDVMQHRMADDVAMAVDALSASNCTLHGCTGGPLMVFTHAGSKNSTTNIPSFYGQATDPVYVITGGSVPSNPTYNPLNKGFHAPNRATTNGADSEDYFMVWDQVQDQYFTFYRWGGSGVYRFPQCPGTINGRYHAGTMSDPCPIGINPSDSMVNPRNDPKGYGVNDGNPWASNDMVAPLGMIRFQELMQGHIYHAIYLNVLCEQNGRQKTDGTWASARVFPSTIGAARPCGNLTGTSKNIDKAPPGGALFFLDYSDEQLAQLKNYMPAWQYPIVEALAHYGGYIGDTGTPLHPSRLESDDAYALAGVVNPFWAWIEHQSGVNASCGDQQCNLDWSNFSIAGGQCPAVGLCDITKHIHIADACVAAGMDAETSSPGPCGTDNKAKNQR
jgi:hypothetical protein